MMEMHPQPVPAFAGEPEMALEGAGAVPMAVAAQPMRSDAVDPNDPATWRNTSRNAPCPCGSGRVQALPRPAWVRSDEAVRGPHTNEPDSFVTALLCGAHQKKTWMAGPRP